MLARQQVRWSEQRALASRVGDEGQGQGRNRGLARSYVSLEQPHHRPWLRQIGGYRVDGRGLVRREPRWLSVCDAGSDLLGEGLLDHFDGLAEPRLGNRHGLAECEPPTAVPRNHPDL